MVREGATCSLKARVCVDGSVAERSKALVLGTSHFDGVGSNPTTASNLFFLLGCSSPQVHAQISSFSMLHTKKLEH